MSKRLVGVRATSQCLGLRVEAGGGGAGRLAGGSVVCRDRRGMSQGLAKAAVLLGLVFLRACQAIYQYIIL